MMDNMQRSVLVRRFLLLLGDLHTHQLRPESALKPRKDGQQRPVAKPRYESAENSWYPKVAKTLLEKATDSMKQAGGAPTRWIRARVSIASSYACASSLHEPSTRIEVPAA